MALIECPECKEQVSDRAKQCPKCAFPIYSGETCRECQAKVATAAFVCPDCGSPLRDRIPRFDGIYIELIAHDVEKFLFITYAKWRTFYRFREDGSRLVAYRRESTSWLDVEPKDSSERAKSVTDSDWKLVDEEDMDFGSDGFTMKGKHFIFRKEALSDWRWR